MNFLVQTLARVSSFFNWDILYRICTRLTTKDRRILAMRLLGEDAETITFKRDDIVWTGYAWDKTTSLTLFVHGNDAGREISSLLTWMKSRGRLNSDKPYIIEAGANIGISTIPLARQSDRIVLAIEPCPENFSLLQRNISQNGLDDRIICVQKAILDKKGNAQMALQSGATGGAEIQQQNSSLGLEARGFKKKGVVEVQGDTIMALLNEQQISPNEVGFVWSDIQGSETFLIKRGEPLWSSGVPLYLEIEPISLSTKYSIDGFIKLVEKYFHSYIEIQNLIEKGTRAELNPISGIREIVESYRDSISHADVLLIPKDCGKLKRQDQQLKS